MTLNPTTVSYTPILVHVFERKAKNGILLVEKRRGDYKGSDIMSEHNNPLSSRLEYDLDQKRTAV
jgi:hypothetical protein